MSDEMRKEMLILKQEIRCSVCLGTLKNPVTTKCWHNFCNECMETLLNEHPSFPCPNCNAKLTKRSVFPNEKLGRIVDAILKVFQAYNNDIARSVSGLARSDTFCLSLSQSYLISQREYLEPKQQIRILVNKSFEKDDLADEESECIETEPTVDRGLEAEPIENVSDEYNQRRGQTDGPIASETEKETNAVSSVGRKKPKEKSRKSVVWDNVPTVVDVPMEVDPYEFVSSQKVTVKHPKKVRKSSVKLEKKLRINQKPIGAKKRKFSDQVVKQNEFYENILGSLTTEADSKLEEGKGSKQKLKVSFKLRKKHSTSPELDLRPRRFDPPELEDRVETHSDSRRNEGQWLKPPRATKNVKKSQISSDWSSSQIKKMQNLNEEYLYFDDATLNVVDGERSVSPKNDKNDKAESEYDRSPKVKRRKIDANEEISTSFGTNRESFVVPFVDVVNVTQGSSVEEQTPTGKRFEELLETADVGQNANSNSNFEGNSHKETKASPVSRLFDGEFASQSSITDEESIVLAPDTTPAEGDPSPLGQMIIVTGDTEDYQNLNSLDATSEARVSTSNDWRRLMNTDSDLLKSLLDNMQCTQEVDEFANAMKTKIRQERTKDEIRIKNSSGMNGDHRVSAANTNSNRSISNLNEFRDKHDESDAALGENQTLTNSFQEISIEPSSQRDTSGLNLLASLLQGQWRKIEPSSAVEEAPREKERGFSTSTLEEPRRPSTCERQSPDDIPSNFFQNSNKFSNEIKQNSFETVRNETHELGEPSTTVIETRPSLEGEDSLVIADLPLTDEKSSLIGEEILKNLDDFTDECESKVAHREETFVGNSFLDEENVPASTSSIPAAAVEPGASAIIAEVPEKFFDDTDSNLSNLNDIPNSRSVGDEAIEENECETAAPQRNLAAPATSGEISEELMQNLDEFFSESDQNPSIVVPNTPIAVDENEDVSSTCSSVRMIAAPLKTPPETIVIDSCVSPQPMIAASRPVISSTQYPEYISDGFFDDEQVVRDPVVDCVMISPIANSNRRLELERTVIERTPSPSSMLSSLHDEEQTNDNNLIDANSIELTQQKTFILCFSGFPSTDFVRLNEFCSRFGCQFRRNFDADVTHLVAKTKNVHGNELCERTMKFFQCMAARVWIISHVWMERSLDAGKLFPVDSFVVNGDTVGGCHNGPEKVRTTNLSSRLFQGVSFYCIEPIENFTDIGQVEDMLRKCGGQICSSFPALSQLCATGHSAFVIGQESSHTTEFYDNLYKKYRVPLVDIEFVLVCLSRYSMTVGYEEFLLCSKNLLEEDFEIID